MSVARAVHEIDPDRLEWLTIEDTDGRVWKYRRIGPADLAEVVHVEGHLKRGLPFRANLIRDNDGHPALRQNGPGLPRVMILEYIEDPSDPFLTNLGLPGKAEYQLVD
jgi:hypothetical protein